MVIKWSNTFLHQRIVTVPHERETALVQAPIAGDVADHKVQFSITVQIRKVHSHAIETVKSDYHGSGGGQRAASSKACEFQTSIFRSVMEHSVGTKIVNQIQFGKQVAIQVSCSRTECPSPCCFFREDILGLREQNTVCARRLSQQDARRSAIGGSSPTAHHDFVSDNIA